MKTGFKRFFKLISVLFGIIALFLTPITLFAQLSSANFHPLTIQDGLSQSSVNCILQDNRNLIWLGTQDGLNRYDGYTFKVYLHNVDDSNSISNSFINAMFQQNDSTLWVGTENGLNRMDFNSNRFTSFFQKGQKGFNKNNITAITPISKNNLLIGTKGGIFAFNTQTLQFKSINQNIAVNKIYTDKENRIWIASDNNGLLEWQQGKLKIVCPFPKQIMSIVEINHSTLALGAQVGIFKLNLINKSVEKQNGISYPISSLFLDKNNHLWVGTKEKGIYKCGADFSVIEHYIHSNNIKYSLISNEILTFYQDNSGLIWVGTQTGLCTLNPQKNWFEHYYHINGNKNSLSDNIIWSILPQKNIIWVGTNSGLDEIDKAKDQIAHYLSNNQPTIIYSLCLDEKNKLWIGSENGLYFLNQTNNNIENAQKLGIKGIKGRVYNILDDDNNYLWLGTSNGLYIIDSTRKKILHYQNDSISGSLPSNTVRQIIQDRQGNTWIATSNGLCFCNKSKLSYTHFKCKVYQSNARKANTISSNRILSVMQSQNGLIWAGTFGGGLNSINPSTGKINHYTNENGLPNNVIYGILEDKKHNIWVSTNKGLARFNPQKKSFRVFTQTDGLQSDEFNTNAYAKGENGKLFFGGINGFNSFNPAKIHKDTTPPTIILSQLYLLNKPISSNSKAISGNLATTHKIVLNYKQNIITFQFSALHYDHSKENSYSYMLKGFDKHFTDYGHTRSITYTNLDPGNYTLMVKAANSDGAWTKTPYKIKLIIQPPFWDTFLFKAIAIIIILLLIYLIYIARVRVIKDQKQKLEKVVEQRTLEITEQKNHIEQQKQELEVEKEKTEKLLLNILPENTVEELKSKGKARARSYSMATVMFTDFIGFTKIAEKLRPKQLVEKLDSYFIKFDEITHKYHIEKIKTIGDSYMCAGGIPIRNRSNAIDVVLAGLEIQRFITGLRDTMSEDVWTIRLGIHTGEIISGVIGIKRFAYDIWGDTVNVASRMESAGQEGKVNISGDTYEHVNSYFDCTYRGKVYAKNKGLIDMFFVNGIKPELSVDGKGIKPNQKFWDYVNLHLFSTINYRKAERYIIRRLEKELPKNLYYHSLYHTLDVCQSVERIALQEGLMGEEIFLLKTAALYHDAGFIEQYESNEPIGARMAQEALPQFGYTEEQVKTITELILATKVPQQPKNKLEQIICDADLDYLGRDDFHYIADKLKKELLERDKVKTDKQWDETQVKFLSAHTYFTKSEKEARLESKLKHIEEVKERLKGYE